MLKKTKTNKILLYSLLVVFIVGWWVVSLRDNSTATHSLVYKFDNRLLKALEGDVCEMQSLILEWNNLSNNEIQWVKNFSDDEVSSGYFLPQTYVSASILLSLVDDINIVAVPKGLRSISLFRDRIKNISLDTDRYNIEEIFSKKPDIAFVAYYSNPAMLEMLKKQGITLFFTEEIDSVEGIINAIRDIGKIVGKAKKAELMDLFVKSALSLENKHKDFRFLYLDFHGQYKALTNKNLSAQFLEKIGGVNVIDDEDHWLVSLSQEDIVQLDPEYIVVVGEMNIQAFKNISAEIYFVDRDIQFFPSQYIVLAYFQMMELHD